MIVRFVVMPFLLAAGFFFHRLVRPQEGTSRF
jgi:hypothetical protein